MKTALRMLLATEVSITLISMAALARVLVPTAGGLASGLLTLLAPSAFRNTALGFIGIVVALMFYRGAALVAILVPVKVVGACVRSEIGGNGRKQ